LHLPSPRKRAARESQQPPPSLSSAEEIRLSVERSVALRLEAKLEQEQNAAEAGRIENASRRFALFRRRIVFGFELLVTLLCLVALVLCAATDPRSGGALISGTGALAGLVSLLRSGRGSTGV